jgi:hypothetical protein
MEIRWPESFALDETARARVESRLRALSQSVDGVQRVTILCRPNPSSDGVEVRIEAVIRRKQFVAVRRRAELEPTMDEAIEAFASCLRLAAAEDLAAPEPSEADVAESEEPRPNKWAWSQGAIEMPRRVLAAAARLPAWERPAARGPRRASAPGAGTRVWRALRRNRESDPDRGPIILPPVIPSYVPETQEKSDRRAPGSEPPPELIAAAPVALEPIALEPEPLEPALPPAPEEEPPALVFRDVVEITPDVVESTEVERVVEELPEVVEEPLALAPVEQVVALAAAEPLPTVEEPEPTFEPEPVAAIEWFPRPEIDLSIPHDQVPHVARAPHSAELPYSELPLPAELYPGPSLYERSSPFVTGSAIAGAAVLVYLVASPLFTMRNPSVFSAIARPAAFTAIARPPAFSAIARPRLEVEEPAAFSAWATPSPRAGLPQVSSAPTEARMSFTAWAKPRGTASVQRARIGADER